MEYTVRTVTARSRHHDKNEDSLFVADDRLIIIADGMGGENDGDVASQMAVKTIADKLCLCMTDGMSPQEVRQLSFEAIRKADEEICSYTLSHPDSLGMGTTVIIVFRDVSRLYISWCGDSRCYGYNSHLGIRNLTKDHSYVQELIDSGRLTEEESLTHPDNNLITRFVGGGSETCIPDFVSYQIEYDDIFVICSDGLSGYCKNDEIEQTIRQTSDVGNLAATLLDLAIEQGSEDDITIATVSNNRFRPRLFDRLRNTLQGKRR